MLGSIRSLLKRPAKVRNALDLLSLPLMYWNSGEPWTLRDAVSGTLVTGGTGQGKSSGSGAALALAQLDSGFGGLVLCAKPGEAEMWHRYCSAMNRLDDLVIFGPDSGHSFNFLDFEMSRSGRGAGQTENIVELLSTLQGPSQGQALVGSGSDPFWQLTSDQLARNAVDLVRLARQVVSVPHLHRVVLSAPTSVAQVSDEEWRASSPCWKCFQEADQHVRSSAERADFEVVADYFLTEFPRLSEKTRSIVVATFTSKMDVLRRGVLRELFCGKTTITPEAIEAGKVIVVDLPVKDFFQVGLYANLIWKHAFQRSIERRDLKSSPVPVFLWADEAQIFTTSRDAIFFSTCRSSWVACTYLTQNLGGFYAALGGGDRGRSETESILGNLSTKVFHGNGDHQTNEWASSQIGRSLQYLHNGNSSRPASSDLSAVFGLGGGQGEGGTSAGYSQALEFEVQPREFTLLRGGGPPDWVVDGIVFQSGRVFRQTGRTWLPVAFPQGIEPDRPWWRRKKRRRR